MYRTLTARLVGRRQANPPLASRRALWLSLGLVALWSIWAAALNSAQFGDNIEQYTWAQSLELGYHKHPPLPSWALGGLIHAFGPSLYWAYALAAGCLIGTAAFTWAVGRRLFGERVAGAGVILWGLSLSFSQRAQLYNHNTVLVLFLAATVWATLRAGASRRRAFLWWLLSGVTAAGALLSKYQALVPLAGIVVALQLSGELRSSTQRQGLSIAMGSMLLLVTPHIVWVVHHDFATLRYASEAVTTSNLLQRVGFVASFLANQLRIEFPALAAVGVCIGWARFAPAAEQAGPAPLGPGSETGTVGGVDERHAAAWSFGLIGLGLIALVLMALCAGVSLRNHWGVQALQFWGPWLAWRWDRRRRIDLRALALTAVAIHAVSLGVYAAEHRNPAGVLDARRIDTLYPARRLAQAAVAHWTQTTSCPLHYVAGAGFDSGLVSLYSGGDLVVFDSATATPWVTPEDLRREGAVYILEGDAPAPPGVTHLIPFELVPGSRGVLPERKVQIGVAMPAPHCGGVDGTH